jgi:serine protease AprX
MDGINSGSIRNLANNAMQTGVPKAKNDETSSEPRDQVTLKSYVKYDKKDLNPNGTLNVIIGAENPEKLEQLKEKLAEDPRNKVKDDLHIINSFSAEVDPNTTGLISLLGDDTKIARDGEIQLIHPVEEKPVDEVTAHLDVANKTMNVDKLHDMGLKGKGKTVAVIDTGIAKHKDFGNRIVGFKDFINGRDGVDNAYDDNKHGTHCAGIIAGDGTESNGKFMGAAPEANLVGVKVLSGSGSGSFSGIIKGIQWCVENKDELGIDVLSMSLGGRASEHPDTDPVAQAVEKAVEKGLLVFIAAGNSGPFAETIGTPAHAPSPIAVGAMDDKGTVERDDDTVARFSSRGPTKFGKLAKPDIIAPGVNITAANNVGGYVSLSGTSMATPHAAALGLLLLQGAPDTKPDVFKEVVMQTADKLKDQSFGVNDQGAGVFDAVEALDKLKAKTGKAEA